MYICLLINWLFNSGGDLTNKSDFITLNKVENMNIVMKNRKCVFNNFSIVK